MIAIETPRLLIRNWEERDRDLFFEINSDPEVMAFFPIRRTRPEADAFFDYLQREIAEKGHGFTPIESKATGETLGFTGMAADDIVPGLGPAFEIGWRLARRHWGQGYATEAAGAILGFGFETLDLDQIVSYAVETNWRSRAVMERLGMRHEPDLDFDHPRVPEAYPHLKRHAFYRLRRDDWRRSGADHG